MTSSYRTFYNAHSMGHPPAYPAESFRTRSRSQSSQIRGGNMNAAAPPGRNVYGLTWILASRNNYTHHSYGPADLYDDRSRSALYLNQLSTLITPRYDYSAPARDCRYSGAKFASGVMVSPAMGRRNERMDNYSSRDANRSRVCASHDSPSSHYQTPEVDHPPSTATVSPASTEDSCCSDMDRGRTTDGGQPGAESLSGYKARYPGYASSIDGTRSASSRTSSIASVSSGLSDVDYKKLYEEERDKNEKLQLRLNESETLVENMNKNSNRMRVNGEFAPLGSAPSEKENALLRRIADLEEELKQMEALKLDNSRLKEENGALIRVISKLSK